MKSLLSWVELLRHLKSLQQENRQLQSAIDFYAEPEREEERGARPPNYVRDYFGDCTQNRPSPLPPRAWYRESPIRLAGEYWIGGNLNVRCYRIKGSDPVNVSEKFHEKMYSLPSGERVFVVTGEGLVPSNPGDFLVDDPLVGLLLRAPNDFYREYGIYRGHFEGDDYDNER